MENQCYYHHGIVAYSTSFYRAELRNAEYFIKTLDTNNGEKKVKLQTYCRTYSIVSLPNGNIASSCDYTVFIWNLNDGSNIRLKYGETAFLVALPNGDLITISYTQIRMWNSTNGSYKRILRDSHLEIMLKKTAKILSGDLAVATYHGFEVWNTDTGALVTKKGSVEDVPPSYDICDLPNGLFASVVPGHAIEIWDSHINMTIRTLQLDSFSIVETLIPLSNGRLASLFFKEFIIWDLDTGKIDFQIKIKNKLFKIGHGNFEKALKLPNEDLLVAYYHPNITTIQMKKSYYYY